MKEYLSQKQISFEDRDITTHPTAVVKLQKLGFMTTPLTVIDEKQMSDLMFESWIKHWLSTSNAVWVSVECKVSQDGAAILNAPVNCEVATLKSD